jgi:hypothetical protein
MYFPFQGPPKYTQIGIFGMQIPIPSGNPAPISSFISSGFNCFLSESAFFYIESIETSKRHFLPRAFGNVGFENFPAKNERGVGRNVSSERH